MMIKKITPFLLVGLLSSCSFAPTYHRPELAISNHYKEDKTQWKKVKLESFSLKQSNWWAMYHDTILNNLEKEVILNNQNIQQAFSRYQAARAELNIARAAYYPTILGIANSYRQQLSKNAANRPNVHTYSDNLLTLNLQYEVDVWGKIRNSVAAAGSNAQASAADFFAIILSMQAALADNYFTLRGDDQAQLVLNQTIQAYQAALDLTRRRYKGGAASVMDVYQAKSQLEIAKTAALDNHLKRMQVEHAIAILIGRVPANFSLQPQSYHPHLVVVAANLPANLLQRRPDIVAAEKRVRAANYTIGIACSAYFPSVNFSAGLGVESGNLSNLISSPSLVWSLGPTAASPLLNNGSMPFLTQILFDGGRIRALSQQAWADYYASASFYKQTVLNAFQEVENSLIGLRQLDKENKTQTAATRAAKNTLNQAMYRYKEGLTTYLDVVIAQTTYLQASLSNVNIKTRRQIESVQLIKSLGGGWTSHC